MPKPARTPTADDFARNEYRDYATYRELARIETVPQFKAILEKLVEQEREDYAFWLQFAEKREHSVGALDLWLLKLMRRVLGLTFTARFLEGHEKAAIRNYRAFLETAEPEMRAKIEAIIAHETQHEQAMINRIQEERVQFLGNVVLGINDGLIELTGALTGFAFALHNNRHTALLGLVTGVSASLSMAASAYMQARHEDGRDSVKAALYTGTSYLGVVLLLVAPFLAFASLPAAMAGMFGTILLLIAGFSFYGSVLFDRDFRRQFGEMLCFSVGVAAIALLMGSGVRLLIDGAG